MSPGEVGFLEMRFVQRHFFQVGPDEFSLLLGEAAGGDNRDLLLASGRRADPSPGEGSWIHEKERKAQQLMRGVTFSFVERILNVGVALRIDEKEESLAS